MEFSIHYYLTRQTSKRFDTEWKKKEFHVYIVFKKKKAPKAKFKPDKYYGKSEPSLNDCDAESLPQKKILIKFMIL